MQLVGLLKTAATSALLISALVANSHARPAFESGLDQGVQATPWTGQPINSNPDNFQFLVVGDRTGGEREGVFDKAVQQINLLQPEFVISIGDLIEGYTEDRGQLKEMWDEFDDQVAALDMPFFRVIGNHDLGNEAMEDVWLARHGATYYHFLYHDVLFLALNSEDPPNKVDASFERDLAIYNKLKNTDPEEAQKMLVEFMNSGKLASYRKPANFSDEQIAYVKKTLADHPDVRWTFVFLHQPAWENPSANFLEIERLLGENDRPYTVFAGHMHYYKHIQRHGRDYVRMGTTGGSFHQEGPGNLDHVTWVTMKEEGPVIGNISLEGVFAKDALDDDTQP